MDAVFVSGTRRTEAVLRSVPILYASVSVSKRYNFFNNRTLKRKHLEYNVLVDWTLLFWHVFACLSGITKKQDHENLTIPSCDVPEPDKRQTCKTDNIAGV
jgi:hypothetical protein